jgi:hypothetical protein
MTKRSFGFEPHGNNRTTNSGNYNGMQVEIRQAINQLSLPGCRVLQVPGIYHVSTALTSLLLWHSLISTCGFSYDMFFAASQQRGSQ